MWALALSNPGAFLGLSVLAEAGSASGASLWLGDLLGAGGALLAAILSGLLAKLLVDLMKKVGLEISKEKEERLRETVRQAIIWVTEWAAKKKKYDKLIVSGEVKLNKAISRILRKLPDVDGKEVEDLVHEEIAGCLEGATNFLEGVAAKVGSPTSE